MTQLDLAPPTPALSPREASNAIRAAIRTHVPDARSAILSLVARDGIDRFEIEALRDARGRTITSAYVPSMAPPAGLLDDMAAAGAAIATREAARQATDFVIPDIEPRDECFVIKDVSVVLHEAATTPPPLGVEIADAGRHVSDTDGVAQAPLASA